MSKETYLKKKNTWSKEIKTEKKMAYIEKNIKEYKVTKSIELLDFLLESCTGMSRNNVKGLLSKKVVSVNGNLVTQFNFVLSKGDIVGISKVPLNQVPVTKKDVKMTLDILYEDEDIIVINKPSGLLTVGNDSSKLKTAYQMLMQYVMQEDSKARVYQVHRIDRDTSGVLMFTKREDLRDAFQERWNLLVKKRGYYAIVEGIMEQKSMTIHNFLQESKTHIMYVSKDQSGEEAITHYRVLKESKHHSLLEVFIDTGKKNQIRVHMNSLGHPIVGDEKYGSIDTSLGRLGLHAFLLEIQNPFTGKIYSFKAPIPREFQRMFA